jgi:universal stress protein A
MKLNRILCPVDFSPYSQAANYYASMFAETCQAEVIYLSVAWPPANEDVEDRLDDLYIELTSKIRPLILDVRHKFEVRDGDPAKEIVRLASEQRVDLIVMGTHGRTGSSRLLYGSVCEKVLRHAACPVMAVKLSFKTDWVLPEADEARPGKNEPPAFTKPE